MMYSNEREAKMGELIREESLPELKARLDAKQTRVRFLVRETTINSEPRARIETIEASEKILEEIENRELREFYKQKFLRAVRGSIIEAHYERKYHEYNVGAFKKEYEMLERLKWED